MRFSPIVPPRRPVFGRRVGHPADTPIVPGPDPDDRRLIERLIRLRAKHGEESGSR